jgi:hypothetical protein
MAITAFSWSLTAWSKPASTCGESNRPTSNSTATPSDHPPPVTITDVYLDEQKTRVLEHSTGLLRAFNKNLEAEARRQAVDELRRAARQGGIYQDAQLQAQQQLTNLFGRLNLEVRFR